MLDVWRLRLPSKDRKGPSECSRRAHCYGMHGSVFKRIALLQYGGRSGKKGTKRLRNRSPTTARRWRRSCPRW